MSKEICTLNNTNWILGDEAPYPMNWEDACDWCKSIGQELPPREVLLLAFLNPKIRGQFGKECYWSSSERDGFAWHQNFKHGFQSSYGFYGFDKSYKLSVRAVWAVQDISAEAPEQEPVAWINGGIGGETAVGWYENDIANLPKGTKLYTAPSKREPLSDDEIYIGFQVDNTNHLNLTSFTAGVRFAEQAHGIGVD
jgi:hypothetical protein